MVLIVCLSCFNPHHTKTPNSLAVLKQMCQEAEEWLTDHSYKYIYIL